MKVKTKIFRYTEDLEDFINKIGWNSVLQVCMNNQQILVIYKNKGE